MIEIGTAVVRKRYEKWKLALIVGTVTKINGDKSQVQWSDSVNGKKTWIKTDYLIPVDESKIERYDTGNLIKISNL